MVSYFQMEGMPLHHILARRRKGFVRAPVMIMRGRAATSSCRRVQPNVHRTDAQVPKAPRYSPLKGPKKTHALRPSLLALMQFAGALRKTLNRHLTLCRSGRFGVNFHVLVYCAWRLSASLHTRFTPSLHRRMHRRT